jgi:hypothetical protein
LYFKQRKIQVPTKPTKKLSFKKHSARGRFNIGMSQNVRFGGKNEQKLSQFRNQDKYSHLTKLKQQEGKSTAACSSKSVEIST